ncbi:TetR/AcrR family transcriptional regulator [Caballeronia sordidicola]|jgi:AcrR family transcriptional regulator|uniref:TetR/AcrR family transcriptional regulator n=1 Tax=Caballeronia sordidicola TaxID=196367 RepID=UPI0004CFEFE7|nr:TetR/AcrR family transcriptional regulator [Caballeronia sordidicola]
MPRIRADDYNEKRSNILNAASSLFAEYGYAGTKMEQIAERCDVSKSMLYHYFERKEDVLFAIMQEHVLRLIKLVQLHVESGRTDNKEEFFRYFVQLWLEPSDDVRARHVVALVDMRYLTDKQKAKQKKIEKILLDLVSNVLATVNGNVNPVERKIYSLLLVGMMNWIEIWYKESGAISPRDLYEMVGGLFLSGFLEAKTRVRGARQNTLGPKKEMTSTK